MTSNTLRRVFAKFDPTAVQVIDLNQDEIETSPHVFIYVTFFNGATPTTPSAGTYTFEVKPLGMENFVAITDGTAIDATASVAVLSFAANGAELRYTPTGITGVDGIEVTIAGNYS